MVVEGLEALKQVLNVKDQNMDNELQKARKTMISVSFLNLT